LILERIQERGAAKTSELSKLFGVSEITIRKDLQVLAERGEVLRTHGGAVARNSLAFEPSYQEKVALHAEEKRRIGQAAADLIKENMAVFIGNGTTTMEIVRHLDPTKPFKAFTNALTHAMELANLPHVELSVIGGHLRWKSYAMVGPLAKKALEGVYFDLVFLGVDGISPERGLTIPSLNEAETAREILLAGERVVIVADHSKFGRVTHGRIAGLEEIDLIITDQAADPDFLTFLVELGVEVQRV
jgi:DeoR/GlpR family transcriptional regulator of sugar metabolism